MAYRQRSGREIGWGRAPRLGALALLVASGACTINLGLDGYSFEGNGGVGGNVLHGDLDGGDNGGASSGSGGNPGTSGNGGAGSAGDSDAGPDGGELDGSVGGANGVGGTLGLGGDGGTGGINGFSGSGGTLGISGSGGDGGTGGTGATGGTGSCGAAEVCVPTIPQGWTGPLVLGANGATGCSGNYATLVDTLHSGLIAPDPVCGACLCSVDPVGCHLESANTGVAFAPTGTCDSSSSPLLDCLVARVDASCTADVSTALTPASWQNTQQTCGGAARGGTCSDGDCFPSGSNICISQSGDVTCPAAFPNPFLRYRDFDDTRSCGCTCIPTGQACTMTVEVCATSVFEVTLNSATENEACEEDDGNGFTLLASPPPTTVTGTCTATGSGAQGRATETDPVTVCCL